MELVRKNLLSIILGVIAILALASIFYPINGWYGELRAQLEGREKTSKSLDQLTRAQRSLPVMQLENAKPLPLEQFPNEDVITAGSKVITQVHDEADLMLKAAVKIGEHKLLLENVLPRYQGSANLAFRDAYIAAVNKTLPTEIVACMPPTDDEIATRKLQLWEQKYRKEIATVDGKATNRAEWEKQFNVERDTLPDIVSAERASQFKIYMDPRAFDQSPAVTEGATPGPYDIWYAQQALWVQEDVAAGIKAANASSKDILSAPVKRLIKMDVAFGPDAYVMPGDASTAGKSYSRIGGRVSNVLYQVVQFSVDMKVEAAKIPQIINALEQDKLITVLQMNAVSVNSADEMKQRFVYGKEPVVLLSLQCEELFLRDWLDKLIPEEVSGQLLLPQKAVPQ